MRAFKAFVHTKLKTFVNKNFKNKIVYGIITGLRKNRSGLMTNNDKQFSKWVAVWGNAISTSDRHPATYAKDLTIRYPFKCVFSGDKIRIRLSNITGTESIKISKLFIAKAASDAGIDLSTNTAVSLNGDFSFEIKAGEEVLTDEVPFFVTAGERLGVTMYFADYTQMNAGTRITGPVSKGFYAYGDESEKAEFDPNLSKAFSWVYFVSEVDIFTEEKNHALICFGDSITAQSWPDYLSMRLWRDGVRDVSVIRRAASGTRILREYDCITYVSYGMKGEKRLHEFEVSGADTAIIQHGINDIIHPVGEEVNRFRPMSDLPTAKEMADAVENLYIKKCRELGLKVYGGTLLPILGWRTYAEFREEIKNEYNEFIRSSDKFDGCIDFAKAVADPSDERKFADGFDSGDHLHPSDKAYKAMADAVFDELFK